MVAGIQRRAKDGKKISAAATRPKSRRVPPSPDPQIARRQALLGKAAHKAWDAEAGYPLGLYFLRGDISQVQFEAGKWYGNQVAFARKVIAAPKAEARTLNMDEGGRNTASFEPSAQDLRRAARHLAADQNLRKNWPRQHRALNLCIIEELWHDPQKRAVDRARPAYTLKALIEGLEEVAKWR